MTTGVSAATNPPGLAYSNAVGASRRKPLAIAVADIFYRRCNLEHAAASLPNLGFGCLLIGLLAIALLAAFSPACTLRACTRLLRSWSLPTWADCTTSAVRAETHVADRADTKECKCARHPDEQDRFAEASSTKL